MTGVNEVVYNLGHMAIMLISAKIGGELFERFLKQPAVLGEIIAGMVIGISGLALIPPHNVTLATIAEIGAVLLLFEIGLHSDLAELLKVGPRAALVALVGLVVPFGLGYAVSKAFALPDMAAIFIGATLTATSVGITARVLGDLKALTREESQIILGAAVLDDIFGMIILAIVTKLAKTGSVEPGSVAMTALIAIVFVVASIIIGGLITPKLLRMAAKMQTRAALITAVFIFILGMSALASLIAGLAPIIGAFAAGAVLGRLDAKVKFQPQTEAIAGVFIPFFFVMMGVSLDIRTLDPTTAAGRFTWAIGGALTLVAIVGKLLAGLVVPKRLNRLYVGVGMMPRGEVGMIFAAAGVQAGILKSDLYAAVLVVVMATTFLTPPLLGMLVKKMPAEPFPTAS